MLPLATAAILLLNAPGAPAEDEDAVKTIEKLGGRVQRNGNGVVTGVDLYNVKVSTSAEPR